MKIRVTPAEWWPVFILEDLRDTGAVVIEGTPAVLIKSMIVQRNALNTAINEMMASITGRAP